MLETEWPKTATSGRSRFSKVLPAPPLPPPDSGPPSKALPSIPSISAELASQKSPPPSLMRRKPVRKPIKTEKALPVPRPSLNQSRSHSSLQSSETEHLQRPPPSQSPSQPPAQQPQSIPQPVESSMPARPPPMSIPRRPVVPAKQNPPAQPLPPLPAAQSPKTHLTPQVRDDTSMSPSDSYGSLLSAYSRSSSGESIIRSSGGYESQRDAEVVVRPEVRGAAREGVKKTKQDADAMSTVVKQPSQSQEQSSSLKSTAKTEKTLPLPPPPPPPPLRVEEMERGPPTPKKDRVYLPGVDEPMSTPTTNANIPGASHQRGQIWRRRSQKSDRAVRPPDLKLAVSHGSTAASFQIPTQSTFSPSPLNLDAPSQPSEAAHSESKAASQPWKPETKPYESPTKESPPTQLLQGDTDPASSASAGQYKAYTPPAEVSPLSNPLNKTSEQISSSTGDGAEPQALNNSQRPHAEPAEDVNMGQQAAKLREKASGPIHSPRSQHESQSANHTLQAASAIPQLPAPRPPTPDYTDYNKQEIPAEAAAAIANALVSPSSPNAPPTPPNEENGTAETKDVPPVTAPAPAPIPRKAVGLGEPNLHGAKSLPQMRGLMPGPGPAATNDYAPASPLPQPPPLHSGFGMHDWGGIPRPGSRGSFRPASRASSRQSARSARGPGFGPGPAGFGPGPGARPFPRPPSKIKEFRELRLEDLPPPDPRALYFPKTTESPALPGTIFQPLPLKASMLDCHVGHRLMRPGRQPQGYPVGCQTCGREDREDRWTCAGCCVRVCGACFRVMDGKGRSVRGLLDYLKGETAGAPTA